MSTEVFSLWVRGQLNKKTHVAVTEKFTFMTSMLNPLAQFQLIPWKSSQYLDSLNLMITPSPPHVEDMPKQDT